MFDLWVRFSQQILLADSAYEFNLIANRVTQKVRHAVQMSYPIGNWWNFYIKTYMYVHKHAYMCL